LNAKYFLGRNKESSSQNLNLSLEEKRNLAIKRREEKGRSN